LAVAGIPNPPDINGVALIVVTEIFAKGIFRTKISLYLNVEQNRFAEVLLLNHRTDSRLPSFLPLVS